ncbi:MAG: fhuA [Chlorobi bacterium]|nr:fhuA [Chlorobiota bacterium]
MLLVCAFAVLQIHIAKAQSTGSVQGTITTTDGDPASSVTVVVKGARKKGMTGRDGAYILKDIQAGKYTIVATHVGLEAQERDVVVVAGGATRLDFEMRASVLESDGVTVTANKSRNEVPVSIGKVNIAPMDLPQSIATVDRTVIEQQQALHLSDVLKNVNGVYQMGGTGGIQEEIAGRGFAFGSSNTFKNGVRFNNSSMPEVSSLERMEVMKGSSAILFGNVAAGGVINLVTKKPKFTPGGEVSMRVGSYNLYKPSIDVYGPVLNSEDVAYRVNASYENAESFRDSVTSDRIYLNPSFLVNMAGNTQVLLEGDYLRDHRTVDYGTGSINYAIAEVPRNQFLGASWSYYHTSQGSATATITHHFDENWQIRGVGGYQSYKNDLFGTTRPNSGTTVQANGNWVRGIQRSVVDEKYYVGQIDFSGRLNTGFLGHTLLVGVDADKYSTQTVAYNGLTKYDSVNIFNMDAFKQRGDIPSVTPRTKTESPLNRAGVYAQDLIAVADWLKVLAGARWSYQQTVSNVLTYANDSTGTTTNYDAAVTPRFGIVYQPFSMLSLFASYSNSFTLNKGVDIDGKSLDPSYINQYEVGVKSDLLDGALSANVTVYQIRNSNLAQTSQANGNTDANIKELAGEVTSRGIELDIMSRPYYGFTFIAGYSYNKTTYTRSNTYIVGSELPYNPNHTANASINYTVSSDGWLNGLNLGASLLYVGDREAGRSTRLTVKDDAFKLFALPNFTQFDISAGYQFSKLAVRAKVSNLFNVLSYYVHDDNSLNPVAPRMFCLTTSLQL